MPEINEDLSGALSQDFRSVRLKKAKERLDALKAQTTPAYANEQQDKLPDISGNSDLSISEKLWSGTTSVLSDVARGVFIESPLQLFGGARDAIQETFEALDDLDRALSEMPGSPDWIAEQLGMRPASEARDEIAPDIPELPEVPEAATFTGDAIRSISQFITGFIPALKAVKGISAGGKALSGLKGVMQTEAAAAISAALVFDPHEERLSNLVESVPALQNPLTDYLQAKPDDSAAEGRLKNALEGLGMGAVSELLVRGVRAIKANRIEKGLEPTEPASSQVSVIEERLSDAGPDAPLVSPTPGRNRDLPFQMNWAKYTKTEEIEGAVTAVARMYTDTIDEARRRTMSEKAIKDLSEQLGITQEDLLSGRLKGGGYKAEEILAMRAILEDSTEKLIELSRIAQDSTDPADLFAFRKMMDTHVAIQAHFQGAASEAGRALRALQIPSGSLENQILAIDSALMQGQSPDEIRRLAATVAQVTDPAEIARAARGSVGKRISDALVEWWYFALLSGPRTHIVNTLSSAANAVWQVPERYLGAAFSALRGTPQGIQMGEATEMMYGMISSLGDAFRAAGRAFVQGTVDSKIETRITDAITSENFPVGKYIENLVSKFSSEAGRALGKGAALGIDALGTIVRTPGRALMAQDEFFKTVGRLMETRALAYRRASSEGLEGEAFAARMQELLDNPPESFIREAENFARSLTFMEQLGPTGQAISNFINQHPVGKIFVPFVRTPINLMKWTGKRTPLALLSQGIRRDIAKGGPAGDMALARMTLGSMVAAVAADLALRGLVTGAGPADRDLKQTWLRTKAPFSVKIGDEWYSYNRADPFGMLLGAAASYAEIAGPLEPDDREEIATAIAMATSQAVLNKTWLEGLTSALDAFHQPDRYGKRYLEQTLGTFLVPTGVAQIAGQVDPVWREVDGIIDAIKNRVPGYSKDLPAWRNLWGEKQLFEGGLGPNIVSPIVKFSGNPRPIDIWLFENRVNIEKPAVTRNGVELTPQQYDRYVELAGNALKGPLGLGLYDTLNAIIEGRHPQSQQWNRLTDGPEGGRAAVVKNYVAAFREMAWAQLLQEDPELMNRFRARTMEKARALQTTIMNPSAGDAP